jgi:hypothetical protein
VGAKGRGEWISGKSGIAAERIQGATTEVGLSPTIAEWEKLQASSFGELDNYLERGL